MTEHQRLHTGLEGPVVLALLSALALLTVAMVAVLL